MRHLDEGQERREIVRHISRVPALNVLRNPRWPVEYPWHTSAALKQAAFALPEPVGRGKLWTIAAVTSAYNLFAFHDLC
eukprot:COSAG06_NODE_37712_length_432_cov_0.528529_1_plen_78_part_10